MALIKVKTKYGTVQGISREDTDFSVFRGIAFAKPPIDELRFKAPEEPDSWEGVHICDTFAPGPVQTFKPGMPEIETSEDCLYLNVFTPAENSDEKLPVMVWFYGGGFQGGSASNPEFDGKAINSHGVILVTVNYRVGALGFFANKELGAANLGLLDQIAALKWINENIEGFGGDPENVTVFGQSAGGMSCRMLITSPLTEGLIHKAIVQSGGGLNEADPVKTGEEFLQMCDLALEKLGWNTADLMTKDALEIVTEMNNAAKAAVGKFQVGYYQPFIDGLTIVDVPGKLVKNGAYGNVKVIDGSVAGDSWMFSSSVKEQLAGNANYFRGFSFAGQMSWAKVRSIRKEETIYTYYMDRVQPERKVMTGPGGTTGKNSPGPGMSHGLPPYGANTPHGTDVAYIFGTLSYRQRRHEGLFTDYDYKLSEVMTKFWTNFAKTGDPNGEGLPYWPKCEGEDYLAMHFGNDEIKAEKIINSIEEQQAVDYTLEHPGLLVSVDGLKEM